MSNRNQEQVGGFQKTMRPASRQRREETKSKRDDRQDRRQSNKRIFA